MNARAAVPNGYRLGCMDGWQAAEKALRSQTEKQLKRARDRALCIGFVVGGLFGSVLLWTLTGWAS